MYHCEESLGRSEASSSQAGRTRLVALPRKGKRQCRTKRLCCCFCLSVGFSYPLLSLHGEEWLVQWCVWMSTGTYPSCRQQLLPRWQSSMLSKVRVFCDLVIPSVLQGWILAFTYFEKDRACLYDFVRQLPGRRQVRQGTSTSSGFANHATLIF